MFVQLVVVGSRVGTNRDAQRTAPRAGEVRSTTASRTADQIVLPWCIGAVDAFRCPRVIAVVLPAGRLVSSLDVKSVVVRCEARVRGRAPNHLDGQARRARATAVRAGEVHGTCSGSQAPT